MARPLAPSSNDRSATRATIQEVLDEVNHPARPSMGCNVQPLFLHPAQGQVTWVFRPVPPLVPGETTLELFVSALVQGMLADTTQIVPSIDECDANGVIIPGGGNVAFEPVDLSTVDFSIPVAYGWAYDPRLGYDPPDISLGDGDGRYLGLSFTAVGDWARVDSAFFKVAYGGPTTTLDETSVNLRDGKGFASGF